MKSKKRLYAPQPAGERRPTLAEIENEIRNLKVEVYDQIGQIEKRQFEIQQIRESLGERNKAIAALLEEAKALQATPAEA